jgi:dihydroflavonol-4-reductase
VFVPTNVSLVDIADCAEGHVLAAQRGVAGERYLLNSIALSITEALALAGEVAGVHGRPRLVPRQVAVAGAWVVEHGSRLARRKPPVCREMVRTLLHGHIYDGSRAERDLGLRYTAPRDTLRKTVDWARAEGLLSA